MRTWILVGDSANARLFETDTVDEPFRLVRAFEHPESRAKGPQLVTDRPSSRQEERGERPRDAEAPRFAHEVAAFLDRAEGDGLFQQLVLVGPPKFLGMLRGRLERRVLKRLKQAIDKDYCGLPPKELQVRLHGPLAALG